MEFNYILVVIVTLALVWLWHKGYLKKSFGCEKCPHRGCCQKSFCPSSPLSLRPKKKQQ